MFSEPRWFATWLPFVAQASRLHRMGGRGATQKRMQARTPALLLTWFTEYIRIDKKQVKFAEFPPIRLHRERKPGKLRIV